MMSEEGLKQAEFRDRINAVDAIREERFDAVYPELAEMMETT